MYQKRSDAKYFVNTFVPTDSKASYAFILIHSNLHHEKLLMFQFIAQKHLPTCIY